MDVEKTIPNSTDNDSTKHSTQDRHDQNIFSNPHKNKKKKIWDLYNDFDFDEDNDGDNKTYQEKVCHLFSQYNCQKNEL